MNQLAFNEDISIKTKNPQTVKHSKTSINAGEVKTPRISEVVPSTAGPHDSQRKKIQENVTSLSNGIIMKPKTVDVSLDAYQIENKSIGISA